MDTFITIAVFAVFIFIVYTKKISPTLKKNREEKEKKESEKHLLPDKDGIVVNSSVTSGNPHKKRTYFEVLAFNPKESENSVFFRERIDLHLATATNELDEKGVDYDYHFFPVGDTFIIILSYQF